LAHFQNDSFPSYIKTIGKKMLGLEATKMCSFTGKNSKNLIFFMLFLTASNSTNRVPTRLIFCKIFTKIFQTHTVKIQFVVNIFKSKILFFLNKSAVCLHFGK